MPGPNIVVYTRCKRSNISSCEPSSVKAWGESGPQNNIAKNLLIRKPLKLVRSTEAFPTPALFLLWISVLNPFQSYQLLVFFSFSFLSTVRGSKQKGCCCCFILVIPKNLVTDL